VSTDTRCVLTIDGTYSTEEACLSDTSCGWKYKCSEGACFLAADGTYATQEECFAECFKWGCDGKGNCVPRADGTYNSPSECRCFSCANNACAPVAANAKGTFATQQECEYDPEAQCGWIYGCASAEDGGSADNFCMKVPKPIGTFANAADCRCVTALSDPGPECVCGYDPEAPATKTKYASVSVCKQDPTDMCGWNYGCNPPLSFSWQQAGRDAQTYNTRTNNSCSGGFPCARYYYFPIIPPFVAYKAKARITVDTSGIINVYGGGGSDWSEADYVLIGYGNYQAGVPDPTTATYKSPKNGQEINVGAAVVLSSGKRTINGRGGGELPGLNNVVDLIPGMQYALCYRLYSQCDDMTVLSWAPGTITLVD
jgi:hypothetical protein